MEACKAQNVHWLVQLQLQSSKCLTHPQPLSEQHKAWWSTPNLVSGIPYKLVHVLPNINFPQYPLIKAPVPPELSLAWVTQHRILQHQPSSAGMRLTTSWPTTVHLYSQPHFKVILVSQAQLAQTLQSCDRLHLLSHRQTLHKTQELANRLYIKSRLATRHFII